MGLSRGEFFARIGLLQEIDPLTDLAYRFAEAQEAGKPDQGAAAEHKWHVSFHGSQFPGDDPKACGRQAIYRLMDMPRNFGSYLFSNRKLNQIADAGKDIEDRLTQKWYEAGYLLSTPPYNPVGQKQPQDTFENGAYWLTSTVDSIVLWPRSVMPVVCEIKTKYADVIDAMKKMIRGPDEKHVKQLKTQLAMARADAIENPRTVMRCHNTDRMAIDVAIDGGPNGGYMIMSVCPQHRTGDCLYECELVPPEYGYIYYVSRDNPIDTHEFYFEYDPKFYEAGLEKLHEWREHFLSEKLPQDNFVDKRFAHPFGWKWTEMPCKWCDYGDVCRTDNKKAIAEGQEIDLRDSAAVEESRSVRPDYDFEDVKNAVLERWDLAPVNSGT